MALGFINACPAEEEKEEKPEPQGYLSQEKLLDPAECKSCHASHYNEWAASMHAYASKDPVFLAMNRRGQRETNGELGSFCVQCHAPMALKMGATTDGLNLAQVPEKLQGVTCYFCHAVEGIAGTHNNPLALAEDGVMRGGIQDPVDNEAHASMYSKLHDRLQPESAAVCGSCHDVITPNGHHLERTFLEWQGSIYGQADQDSFLSCGDCHMNGRTEAAVTTPGAPLRRRHRHLMPGVDVAITPFPDHENHLAAVQEELDYALEAHLCMEENENLSIRLGNIGAGHGFPSGAAHDRRVWLEVQAFSQGEEVWSHGVMPEDVPLAESTTENHFSFFDHTLDENGEEALMFWEVVDNDSFVLEAPDLSNLGALVDDKHRIRDFDLSGLNVDEVKMKVKMRPIALHIIDSLIDSGDLDAVFRDKFPTFTLKSTEITWKTEDGLVCLPW